MNNRKIRLPEIVDILTRQFISSQEELSRQLAVRGHAVTQATLSRDLKLLKANKISDERGGYRYVVGDVPGYVRPRQRSKGAAEPVVNQAVLSVAMTGNLVVVKTRNGYASGLAYDIDMIGSPLVLGTIPGSDTEFVAIRECTPRSEVFSLLSTFVPQAVMTAAAPMFLDSAADEDC